MCCSDSTRPIPPTTAADVVPDRPREEYRVVIEKAKRCFRLVRSINEPDMAGMLEQMGDDYLREAERLCHRR